MYIAAQNGCTILPILTSKRKPVLTEDNLMDQTTTHAARFKILVVAILLASAAAILLARNSSAQEEKPPSLPLPEMRRLSKLFVGKWEYTETYPKSPLNANGGVNTGVYTSELGPGGNSIINRFHSKGPVGEFEGVIVMTWDPKEKAYKEYFFSDTSPGAAVEMGQWEGDDLVYRLEFSAGESKFVLRNSTKFLSGDKLTSDQYSSVNGAPEKLLVHVEAVKK
jgi:hypothetical protein